MTWLKGTTTIGAVAPLLTQLICGEVADGVGNTCAAGDQWVRENAGQDTIRTKAALDFTPPVWQMRTGYFNLYAVPSQIKNGTNAPGYNRNVPGAASVCQVTSPYTSSPAVSHNRWVTSIRIRTANTTPGDYSTARVDYSVFDADNGTGGVLVFSTTNQALSSSGAITLSNGCHIQLTDPSGTLVVNTEWNRGFTSTYLYGIDSWPWWSRRGNGVTTPTWTTAPPGTAGTDYDIIDQVTNSTTAQFQIITTYISPGTMFSGLGIKTNTGLGASALYSGTYPIALMKCRMFNSATLGILQVDPGPSPMDSVNGSVNRPSGCPLPFSPWVKCIQTPASANTSTAVQYFLSVKADGVYIILNADPAGTGKLGTGYIGTFTPNDPTIDKFPVCLSAPPIDFASGNNSGDGSSPYCTIPYWLQKRMANTSIAAAVGTATSTSSTTLVDTLATRTTNQDVGLTIYAGSSHAVVVSNTATTWTVASWVGGTPGSTATYTVQRDWQTGWHRSDFQVGGTAVRYDLSEFQILSVVGMEIFQGAGPSSSAYPVRQQKPSNFDDTWWLWGISFVEGSTFGNTGNTEQGNFYRGYQNTRYFYIPGDGWGNGDELTDTGSGEKFLLLTPDYCGAAQRINTGTNIYTGGVAVAEL